MSSPKVPSVAVIGNNQHACDIIQSFEQFKGLKPRVYTGHVDEDVSECDVIFITEGVFEERLWDLQDLAPKSTVFALVDTVQEAQQISARMIPRDMNYRIIPIFKGRAKLWLTIDEIYIELLRCMECAHNLDRLILAATKVD